MHSEFCVLHHLNKQRDGHGAKARPFNFQADRSRPFKAWLYTEKTGDQRPSQAVQKPSHTFNVTVAGHGKTEFKDHFFSSIRSQSNLPLSYLRGVCGWL